MVIVNDYCYFGVGGSFLIRRWYEEAKGHLATLGECLCLEREEKVCGLWRYEYFLCVKPHKHVAAGQGILTNVTHLLDPPPASPPRQPLLASPRHGRRGKSVAYQC